MKMILFASALALSTAAFAQTTPPEATPATTTPDATPQTNAGTPSTTPSGDMSTTQPSTDSTNTPPAAPMTPATGDTGMASGAASTDDSNLPTCSKTVTDKCKQGGKATGHKTMHHKKK